MTRRFVHWFRRLAIVTMMAFFMAVAPGCTPEPTSRVGTAEQAMAGPRKAPPKKKPTPKKKAPAKKKPAKKKTTAKKKGTKKKAAPAKKKPGKTATKKRAWSAKEWTAKFAKWTIIGLGFITLGKVFIKTLLEALAECNGAIADFWKKFWEKWNAATAPDAPPPPPGGVGALPGGATVACSETETEIVCVVTTPGACDPDTLGPDEVCLGETETCEVDGDGFCDPELEECCGDDVAGACELDETGDATCDATNPCAVFTATTDELGLPVETCEVVSCDTTADTFLDVDDPEACGPIVELDECSIEVGGCIELDDGTVLGDNDLFGGGGECCGDVIELVDACVCEQWICDGEGEDASCIGFEMEGTDHLCAEISYCDQFADESLPPDVDDVDTVDAGPEGDASTVVHEEAIAL